MPAFESTLHSIWEAFLCEPPRGQQYTRSYWNRPEKRPRVSACFAEYGGTSMLSVLSFVRVVKPFLGVLELPTSVPRSGKGVICLSPVCP